jgi:hypothetical protein
VTDRELLEKAAKAVGYEFVRHSECGDGVLIAGIQDAWRPLVDDGDALRLACRLKINIEHMHTLSVAVFGINCWPHAPCNRPRCRITWRTEMSRITNLVLLPGVGNSHWLDDPTPAWVTYLDEAFQGALTRVDQYARGCKSMEATVYVAALRNIGGLDSVRDSIESAPWGDRSTVRYLVREQEDDAFTFYALGSGVTPGDLGSENCHAAAAAIRQLAAQDNELPGHGRAREAFETALQGLDADRVEMLRSAMRLVSEVQYSRGWVARADVGQADKRPAAKEE